MAAAPSAPDRPRAGGGRRGCAGARLVGDGPDRPTTGGCVDLIPPTPVDPGSRWLIPRRRARRTSTICIKGERSGGAFRQQNPRGQWVVDVVHPRFPYPAQLTF